MTKIISKPNSVEYDENYDKIFKKEVFPKYGYWYDSNTGEYYYHDERGDKFVSTDEVEWRKE